MTYNRDMLSAFKRKHIEVPFYSNQTMVYSSPSVNVGYKILDPDQIKKLTKDHMDIHGLRSVPYLYNLSKCNNIKRLAHPLVVRPLINDLDDDSYEIITLLEKDKLNEF